MKKILILSGKGGTGKTTIASSFIKLSKSKFYADCDVDAPNLDILFHKDEESNNKDFLGLPKAKIDLDKCIHCGLCKELCRFNAIKENDDGSFYIDEYLCEGCSVCEANCPAKAIIMNDDVAGRLKMFDTINANNDKVKDIHNDKNDNDTNISKDKSVFSTAKLKMGRGNSGKLVSKVKEELDNEYKEYKQDMDADKNNSNYDSKELDIESNSYKLKEELMVIDGSPGIGCPVIASIAGVDFVLMVVEPSLSGISDMKRLVTTLNKFRCKKACIINKYDLNKDLTDEIIKYLDEEKIPFVGKVSYDEMIQKDINQEKCIMDFDDSLAKHEICDIFINVMRLLNLM